MGVDQRTKRIRASVTEQVGLVLESEAFSSWVKSELVNPDDSSHVRASRYSRPTASLRPLLRDPGRRQ